MTEELKTAGDFVSAGVTGAALLGWLPHIATLLTIIWMAGRIYEADWFRDLFGMKRKQKKETD